MKVGNTVAQDLGLIHIDRSGSFTTGSLFTIAQTLSSPTSALSGFNYPTVFVRSDYTETNSASVSEVTAAKFNVYDNGTINKIGAVFSSGSLNQNTQANHIGLISHSQASNTGGGVFLAKDQTHIGLMGIATTMTGTFNHQTIKSMYQVGGRFESRAPISSYVAANTGDSLYRIALDVVTPNIVTASQIGTGSDENWYLYEAGIRVNMPNSDNAWNDKVYAINVVSGKTLLEDSLQVTDLPNLASPTYNLVADANGVLHSTTPSQATLKETTSQALASTATYTHIGSLDTTGLGKNVTRTDSTITVQTAGTYRITYNFSIEIAASGAGTWLVQFQPFRNAAAIAEMLGSVQVVTGGAETWRQVISGETIMDLSASDVISLRYTATAGPTYTLYPGTITLEKL